MVPKGTRKPKRISSTLWLATVHFPTTQRTVRRFLVHGADQRAAEARFAEVNVAAGRCGVPLLGPQQTVEWVQLSDDGVIELPEARYR